MNGAYATCFVISLIAIHRSCQHDFTDVCRPPHAPAPRLDLPCTLRPARLNRYHPDATQHLMRAARRASRLRAPDVRHPPHAAHRTPHAPVLRKTRRARAMLPAPLAARVVTIAAPI
ncbi:hypothetical protein GGX14DRAFT_573576 [Mycena pura]|uniref:Uncharacterized protein n=1 Tax=Mycena pura TaxID=153505 RepID=A0AAD6Y7S7_9AGAR|nr:hypothetical protein GGX14DRAFT_573576 [Mycena pura]